MTRRNQTQSDAQGLQAKECKHSWVQDAPIKVCYHCGYKPQSPQPQPSKGEIEKIRYPNSCDSYYDNLLIQAIADKVDELIDVLNERLNNE